MALRPMWIVVSMVAARASTGDAARSTWCEGGQQRRGLALLLSGFKNKLEATSKDNTTLLERLSEM